MIKRRTLTVVATVCAAGLSAASVSSASAVSAASDSNSTSTSTSGSASGSVPGSVSGTDLNAGTNSWTTAVGDNGDVTGAHSVSGHIHGFVWHGGTLVDLPPGANQDYSIANAVDAGGDVVGTGGNYGFGYVHAYEWKGGSPNGTDFGALYGNSFANAVNTGGEIAGQSQTSLSVTVGALLNSGVPTVLPDLGGSYTAPMYLNDAGTAAGYSLTPSGDQHAVVWIGGKLTDLGIGTAAGLNAQGQVLVASAQGKGAPFLWTNGVQTTFGAGVQTVTGLNNAGQVVGTFLPAGSTTAHGFVWQNGQLTDLGAAFFPTAVNNVGQVLGNTAADSYGLGVVWYQGQVTTLTPTSGQYSEPEQLNDNGLVAGIVQGTQDATVWQLPAVSGAALHKRGG
ncbi:hypothetical protein [Catenulispora pinisilvae]|uniref:hypothetical protein n=1 Tax=Catenulispora pinisilvae TaxID=2705253 RepID=UPI00189209F0|nr:hypothetical protein [Catenulispora pinisilvae]